MAGSLRHSVIRCVGIAVLGAIVLAYPGGCGTQLITYAGESRQQGIQLYNSGNYADAAGAFTNAIRQDPIDYHSHYYLGRTYAAMKQYHQAVSSYRTALDVMAQSLAGRDDAAFRLKVLDGLATAAAAGNNHDLEQSALQNRTQPTAEDQLVLAKIARIHGDVDSAVDAYNGATLLDPNNLPVAKEYGLYLAQLGQSVKAKQQLTHAYALNRKAGKPDDPEVVAALRQVGVVPGPSLADQGDLAKPIVPEGPLPAAEDVAQKLGLQDNEKPASTSAGTAGPRE